eukprot:TRINITY_DN6416_c0_g1_i1.p1 TRINITY_DN6416_c0_g1~~TRINITY_DN6416_c0_g1_i1.p1  ORF type:complete len:162 (-),score=24.81 TRINITY_DN6416_c0_g1_i1:88-573(-)
MTTPIKLWGPYKGSRDLTVDLTTTIHQFITSIIDSDNLELAGGTNAIPLSINQTPYTGSIDATLADAGIVANVSVSVRYPSGVRNQIYVKTLNGNVIHCTGVETSWSVLDLKKRVKELHGAPVDHQRIIFGGKELMDEKLLFGDYNLEFQSTVHLVLLLRD